MGREKKNINKKQTINRKTESRYQLSEARPLLHGSPVENMRGCRRGRREAAAAVVVVVQSR